MGNPTAFKEFPRETPKRRPVSLRLLDWNEVYEPLAEENLRKQASRCMDCGIPFCNNGCPLGNIIPDWNDLVHRDRWEDALAVLSKTNNFPEFTGRVCPAPCEEACVLGLTDKAVTIKNVELSIIEHAFASGLLQPRPPATRTGKRVAVVGSGPAGLACAAQLNTAGHRVTVYERDDRVGGLLMYGIPDFKLEKRVIDRRIALMQAEGIAFVTGAHVGKNTDVEDLRREFDAIVLCGGSTVARDLNIFGRDLAGIHLAMQYLPLQNRLNLGDDLPADGRISAEGKHVIILGGGDTGADCLGTALRQKCKSVRQIELLPRPPEARSRDMPWPYWPLILRASSAHEEGEAITQNLRDFAIQTKYFAGQAGHVARLGAIRLEWSRDEQGGRTVMKEIPGSEFELECDLCLLALGFTGPERDGPIAQLGLSLDARGNVATDQNYMSSVPGVFAAGDMRRGQSLVVWAISEGRQAARGVDAFLMGQSDLPAMQLF
jgi:glutamate synthase (NADPH) small chain